MAEDLEVRVAKIEERVNVMDKTTCVLSQIVSDAIDAQKQFTVTMKELGSAISSIQLTMKDMQNEIHSNTQETNEMKEKINNLETSFKSESEKGHIDIVTFVKNNIVAIIAILYIIIQHVGLVR